jgi:site-specific recombinase XerD
MPALADKSLFKMIHDFLRIYLPKQQRCSMNTQSAYRIALEQLIDFVKNRNHIPLYDITFEMMNAEIVQEFLESIEFERGCSISTRNHRLAAVRSFLSYAAARDVTVVALLNSVKKVPIKKLDTVKVAPHMSEAAVQAILTQPDVATPKGLRDRFFMILMYDTGARLNEMLSIKLLDFRLGKTPALTLHGKGNKERSVPLMERTVEHLRLYLETFHPNTTLSEDAYLFYLDSHNHRHPLSHDCVGKFINKYGRMARKVCVEVPENVHPHLWRHTRAMHLYQHGMDLSLVSQWLGHEHIETTQVYAHADTELKRKAIESATKSRNPLGDIGKPKRFTVNDELQLKRLYGLK